ncbi:MAG TPA: sulfotransferase [Blastocatellia bacterium]|nr:sulfotransferase [Blastocatellia bacterium]
MIVFEGRGDRRSNCRSDAGPFVHYDSIEKRASRMAEEAHGWNNTGEVERSIMNNETIVIVSGLPRSGTSMMMRMLTAGGIEALTDNLRTADEDNPKGYFEFEKVKELEKDDSWLADARGKAVKIISKLLKHLPARYSYRVIFMRRKMDEILASQRQMLIRRGEPADTISDRRMAEIFERHLKDVQAWLENQPNIEVIYVDYNETLADPSPSIERINEFLGGGLDASAMMDVVEKALYRQQR